MAISQDYTFTTTTANLTIWSSGVTVGADGGGTSAVEVGVKFRSDVAGYISGIRFYKHAQNTGTHTGSLWTTGGTRLGQVTFTSETASGWQEARFATPIAIAANTTYIASYFAPTGHFAFSANYFTSAGVDNAPIHALRSGVDGPNGVFVFGSTSSFPNLSYQNGNYWVDVILAPPCSSPGVASNPSPANRATGISTALNLSWSASANTDSYDVYFGTSSPPPKVGSTSSTSYALPDLNNNTLYYWQIVSRNTCGNSTAGPIWSFTTVDYDQWFSIGPYGGDVSSPCHQSSGTRHPLCWNLDGVTVVYQEHRWWSDTGLPNTGLTRHL